MGAHETFKFVWKLAILSSSLYLVPLLGLEFWSLRQLITEHAFLLLSVLGEGVGKDGFLLLHGGNAIAITRDCVPWKLFLFFSALLLASRLPLRKKILGAVCSIPLLYVLNVFRIAALVYASSFGTGYFGAAHLLFQLVSIAFTVGLWVRWNQMI